MRSRIAVETALYNIAQTVEHEGNTDAKNRAIGATEALIWMLDEYPNHLNLIWNGKPIPYERGMYNGIV